MRCRACDVLLKGNELYRRGINYDLCGVCVPFDDSENGCDFDQGYYPDEVVCTADIELDSSEEF